MIDRRTRTQSRAAVILVATLVLLGVAAAGSAQPVPNPTVTGPIGSAGIRGHALWDSWFELSEIGYMEEEYFISGSARTAPA